ncbi:MAG: lysine--tRNA ligase [Anaerolineae bacterium]
MTNYTSWPFKEARGLQKRFKDRPPAPVTFETGFGPSGLPHIGTFAEVARTTWVRRAFEHLTGRPTQLIAFSDDMDGLRKVPLNMPRQDMLAQNLGKPLCHIPDPFDCCRSYSDHMNRKLQEFLDAYGFDYRFQSSQQAYSRGDFDEGLSILLQKAEQVRSIILPTLREDKQTNWSPFFPICRRCGRLYSTRVTGYHPADNTVDYRCDIPVGDSPGCGHSDTVSVLGGRVKVGWKVDWALRWYAYDVAYEMYGKDLIESARLSGKITRLMGKQPPNGFFYELFLDEAGRKISKSVGKGLTVDSWVSYAPLESLLHFLFQSPTKAKRLFWGVVPKSVDDYLADLRRYPTLLPPKQPDSALWHIFKGGQNVPAFDTTVNFSLINNLIAALGADDATLTIKYLERYDPSATDYRATVLDLVGKGLNYYRDFILPNKQYRPPTPAERPMLQMLRTRLAAYAGNDEKELQTIPFDVARAHNTPPGELFKAIYELLLGQERGPRVEDPGCREGQVTGQAEQQIVVGDQQEGEGHWRQPACPRTGAGRCGGSLSGDGSFHQGRTRTYFRRYEPGGPPRGACAGQERLRRLPAGLSVRLPGSWGDVAQDNVEFVALKGRVEERGVRVHGVVVPLSLPADA